MLGAKIREAPRIHREDAHVGPLGEGSSHRQDRLPVVTRGAGCVRSASGERMVRRGDRDDLHVANVDELEF